MSAHLLAVLPGFRIRPECIKTEVEFEPERRVAGKSPAATIVAWGLVKLAQKRGSWKPFDLESAKQHFLCTAPKSYSPSFFDVGFSRLVETRFVLPDGSRRLYNLSIRFVENALRAYPMKPQQQPQQEQQPQQRQVAGFKRKMTYSSSRR